MAFIGSYREILEMFFIVVDHSFFLSFSQL
jgi:hypothetical protein